MGKSAPERSLGGSVVDIVIVEAVDSAHGDRRNPLGLSRIFRNDGRLAMDNVQVGCKQ